jgi:LuxR family maltose regulon positive regulatory protein
MAYVCRALRRDEQARASIQEAKRVYSAFSPWGIQYAAAHQTLMDVQRGELDAAARWAQSSDLILDGEFVFHRQVEYTALAHVFLAQKRFAKARSLAERIYQIALETGSRQTELEGLILMALLSADQGESEQALVYLARALSIAEPGGYVRIFVDEGLPMASLLYEALSSGIAAAYVQRLLAAFPKVEPEQVGPPTAQIPDSALIEPLSDRELEVLRLIAEGLTNREIASRLYLALNTVKAHSSNIYGKLNVHSRTQAIARAQVLGLLPHE